MVDVLLQAGDALRAQLARHQAGGAGEAVDTALLLASIRALAAGQAPAAAPLPRPLEAPPLVATAVQASATRTLELLVGPLEGSTAADNLVELFGEIVDLGTIEALDGDQAADGMRRFKVTTDRKSVV